MFIKRKLNKSFEYIIDGVSAGPPRKSFSQVLEMTDQGLSFSLAAYHSPDHFRFFHLGNRTSGNGSEVSSGRFSSLCLQNAVKLSHGELHDNTCERIEGSPWFLPSHCFQ